jgi:hypothetical protein
MSLIIAIVESSSISFVLLCCCINFASLYLSKYAMEKGHHVCKLLYYSLLN